MPIGTQVPQMQPRHILSWTPSPGAFNSLPRWVTGGPSLLLPYLSLLLLSTRVPQALTSVFSQYLLDALPCCLSPPHLLFQERGWVGLGVLWALPLSFRAGTISQLCPESLGLLCRMCFANRDMQFDECRSYMTFPHRFMTSPSHTLISSA